MGVWHVQKISNCSPEGWILKTYRFDRFEVDFGTGDLRRQGVRVAMAPKVAELLLALVESSNNLVTREDLQSRLWPDTHTDRERGLNNAMNRLREALGDSAAEPRFIETVPKRGYRFLPRLEEPRPPRIGLFKVLALAAAVLVFVVIWIRWPRHSAEAAAPAEYFAALRKLKLGGTGDLKDARSLLDAAIIKSPMYAPAYAALAPVLLDLIDAGAVEPGATRRLATEAAQTAVRLQADSSDAHLAMGLIRLRADWQLQPARHEIERAIRLSPNSAEAWRAKSSLLLASGDAAGAVEAAERSVALEPLSPWIQTASGRAIYYNGEFGRSIEQLERAIRIAPEFSPAHRYLSEVYWQSGRKDDARREFLATMNLAGMDTAEIQHVSELTAREGLPGYWRSQLGLLEEREDRQGVPFKLAAIHAAMDHVAEAIQWLDRAIGQKDVQLLFLRVNPRFNKLRSNPGFEQILRRIPSS